MTTTRIARQAGPLPCFGLWNQATPKCAVCEHFEACKASAPGRKQNVPFMSLRFSLTPEAISPGDPSYSIFDDIQALYSLCHLTIYETEPHDQIGRVEHAVERLNDICEELGCSTQLFILSVMTSAKSASPDRPFYANMLFGPSAVSRFEGYRETCRIKFGTFDLKTLELECPSSIRRSFIQSECLFGQHIIDTIIHQEGDVAYEDFYLTRELAFNPLWLAIEPSYFHGILKPHVEGQIHKTAESIKFRSVVAQARRSMFKSKTKARAVFALRENIIKEAAESVLNRYRLRGEDFLYEPVFTNAMEFWMTLGLATRRIELLRIIGDIA